MAKVIVEDNRVARSEGQIWLQILGYGAAVGAAWWLLALIITSWIIEPLACSGADITACADASILGGRLSAVIIGIGAIFGMIRLGIVRPIIVAVASAVVLWNLSVWIQGLFWLESITWAVVLYALAYGLFGWIARHLSTVVAVVFALLFALGITLAMAWAWV